VRLKGAANGQEQHTKVIKNTLDPVWHQQTTFYFENPEKDQIAITLFDHDLITEDEELATAIIPLGDFVGYTSLTAKEYELHAIETSKNGGTLVVRGKTETLQSLPVQAPASTESFVEEKCQFSWGSYGSEFANSFPDYADYGKGISDGDSDEEKFHHHPPPPALRKVGKS
jgi:hypothetical protein